MSNLPTENDLKQISNLLTAKKLPEAFYDFYKTAFARGGIRIAEDRRAADFLFYIPDIKEPSLRRKSCLMIGAAAHGLLPLWLSDYYDTMVVIDDREGIKEFLSKYFSSVKKSDSERIIADPEILTSEKITGEFNTLIISPYIPPAIFSSGSSYYEELLARLTRHLKPNGSIALFAENPISGTALLSGEILQKRNHTPHAYRSLNKHIKIFKKLGFSGIQAIAPLPLYNATPLFFLPVYPKRAREGATKYFFKNLFSMFEMVSPEVKKKFAKEYFISKILISLTNSLNLTNFITKFLSGYIIIAHK